LAAGLVARCHGLHHAHIGAICDVLTDAGIDFEIVPGVTAAIAAAAYTGIMLTDRTYSSQVVFVTGHEADDKAESNIDWNWLAGFAGTIVFYMAMGNLESIAEQLIKNGMTEDTPAAVITNATFPTQRTVKAPLHRIADKCRKEKIEPPAIVIIGDAADSDARFNWLTKKPLFGKNIVVTRDARGNADFAAKIIRQGGNPIEFPAIKIKPLTQTNKFLQTLAKIADYDWVIFTSANGVRIFFDVLHNLSKDSGVFGSAKIAAIGSETGSKLVEFGIRADFVPSVFTGKDLAKQLIAFTNLQSKKVLLMRSQAASNELVKLLQQAKAQVDEVAVYTTLAAKSQPDELRRDIADGAVHWVTFASPSAVKGFFEQIPGDLVNSSNVKVASIGPVTSEELKRFGVTVDVETTEHTIDGLLAAIEGTYK